MDSKNRKRSTREEFEQRRTHRKLLRLKRRAAERVKNAKRTLKGEDCPIRRMNAQHILIEEEIAERIDVAKQELEDTKKKNRVELQNLRKKNDGKKARSKRRIDPHFLNSTPKAD